MPRFVSTSLTGEHLLQQGLFRRVEPGTAEGLARKTGLLQQLQHLHRGDRRAAGEVDQAMGRSEDDVPHLPAVGRFRTIAEQRLAGFPVSLDGLTLRAGHLRTAARVVRPNIVPAALCPRENELRPRPG